jgi:hypothetical protein
VEDSQFNINFGVAQGSSICTLRTVAKATDGRKHSNIGFLTGDLVDVYPTDGATVFTTTASLPM